jgi:hypothetical protein
MEQKLVHLQQLINSYRQAKAIQDAKGAYLKRYAEAVKSYNEETETGN